MLVVASGSTSFVAAFFGVFFVVMVLGGLIRWVWHELNK